MPPVPPGMLGGSLSAAELPEAPGSPQVSEHLQLGTPPHLRRGLVAPRMTGHWEEWQGINQPTSLGRNALLTEYFFKEESLVTCVLIIRNSPKSRYL